MVATSSENEGFCPHCDAELALTGDEKKGDNKIECPECKGKFHLEELRAHPEYVECKHCGGVTYAESVTCHHCNKPLANNEGLCPHCDTELVLTPEDVASPSIKCPACLEAFTKSEFDEHNEFVSCPHCSEKVKRGASKCKNCKEEIG